MLNWLSRFFIVSIVAGAAYLCVDWAILQATFTAHNITECNPNGACWAIVNARWQQFIFGFYPSEQLWRVFASLAALIGAYVLMIIPKLSGMLRTLLSPVALLVGLWLAYGKMGLTVIPTQLWGGLFLTLFISLMSIYIATPLGVLLALGKRSHMPLIKAICSSFIEIIRGVPLISVLFMASVMLPFFLPVEWHINKLLRACIGITLFQAAYLAEVIRGGLNAIPQGQFEASDALGLNYYQKMRHIIMPQVFTTMIPGLVNSYIALLKDTTLVLIIGLYDFLGIIQASITDPKWLGLALEAYLFCALIYWIICFSLSYYSKRLEHKLKFNW